MRVLTASASLFFASGLGCALVLGLDAAPFVPDAGADGDVLDAGAEGASDAAAAAPFCDAFVQPPSFCADFDEGNVTQGWSGTSITSGSVVSDPTESTSPPFSAHATLLHRDAACDYATLDREDVGAAAPNVHFETQLWRDPAGVDQENPTILVLELVVTPTITCKLLVGSDVGATTVHEQDELRRPDGSVNQVDSMHRATPQLPAGRWVKLVVDVDLSRAPGTYTLSVDGRTLQAGEPLRPECTGKATVSLHLGYSCASTATIQDIRFDDVALDLR